ncbi:MFS transporter [Diaminobutyricimonas aerilata]|uniref:MFS transporter n=1 Tax=Diaminobutyricimonas aerilata TaxID=1162967 RepID=A0A2M9CMF8_9MICO|nr:MFS transporter [Diaminobutyricimonas aerilata]PJJ73079.1 MFS transporter [Diaminobutyricimonas aerilata]
MSSTTSEPLAPVARLTGRPLAVLLVLCGALFLEGIDVAMLNIALPAIRADLGLTTGELQWVMSAYILGYGGFMLLGGRAADLFGRRRVFLVPLVVFLAFSGLGAIATEGWMLIAARVVTGVAAAFMTPAGLSIITTMFAEGAARNRAVLIYSGVGAAGFSIGLVAGGLLTVLGWRWVFIAPVILSALLLALAIPLIPKVGADPAARGRLDVLGAVTITAALVVLVLTIEQAPHTPALLTAAGLVSSAALIAAFVAIERRASHPLVRLGVLRSAPLVRANLGGALLAAAFMGFQFIVVLYLQEFRGWTALETSLAMLVVAIDGILAPTLTPRLVARFGTRRVAAAGFVSAIASYALFLPVASDWTYAAMFPSFLLLGIAYTLAYGPLTIAATDGVVESEQGLASGLLYTASQFGGALGLSIATAVYIAAADAVADPLETYRLALIVPLATAVLALVITVVGRPRRVRRA